MQRDLIGYGSSPPKVIWPHKARIALNFVLNYEEGSELTLLNGDRHSESYATDLPGAVELTNERHLSVESQFEYGSRTGIWRLLNLFEESKIALTIFAAGLALEQNLELANKLKDSPYDIVGHGYRWINYREVSEDIEREHIQKTIHLIHQLTGKQVSGWYTGRRSQNTRKLIAELGLRYDSESYADDLPYWIDLSGRDHLIIPYSLDTNDIRYTTSPGWNNGQDFFQYLKDAFDCLYHEGQTFPKMMTVGLHARLSGRPGRYEALRRFIDYIKKFDKVWICRREEIANHWHHHHKRSS